MSEGKFEFFDLKPPVDDMRAEVEAGLRAQPKHIPPKYFYDDRGSALFEAITELPEYYLTRTEMMLFDAHSGALKDAVGEGRCVVEYGSGSSKKIRKLLEHVRPSAYMPLDISKDHLEANARQLFGDFPWLDTYPVCADFTGPLQLPDVVQDLPKVGFFPGSSIGNFAPGHAADFLHNVSHTLGVGGELVVGVDRKKDIAVLENAYNDAQGVTAAFNLNVLQHLNDELGANFELDGFAHTARYNEADGCIQMFLQSNTDQQVTIGDAQFDFRQDEELHTENSYKYNPDEFMVLAAGAGFAEKAHFTDVNDWFSLYVLQVAA